VPRKNRVSPLGALIAHPGRGLVYGNRGCLHDAAGHIRRHHNGRRWIACRLEFRGWQRGPMLQPGRFTELFFLDEATAFAAGHRPCALCRRADYDRFLAICTGPGGRRPSADDVDARLHAQRFDAATGVQRHHAGRFDELPEGSFVLEAGEPWLVAGGRLLRWTPEGYAEARPRPADSPAVVITPPMLVTALRSGWDPLVPLIHPSARDAMPELQCLRADHAAAVLAFELANRAYFAASISDRGDEFFDHFAERHSAMLAEQAAGIGAFHVLVAEDGSVLGRFNLFFLGDGTANLGYRVAQRVAGRGVATTNVREVCRLAGTRYGLRRLRAATAHENAASQKVLVNAGFVPVSPADPADLGGKSGTWYQRDLTAD
jgi:ribosomal-protein-alanine N-acetyltransferase